MKPIKGKEFNDMLKHAFLEIQGSSGFSLDKDRAYDGQPTTHNGERGKEPIKGLTVRDIADCIVRGFLESAGIYDKHPLHDDIFKINMTELSPGAVIQSTVCNIEKMMGIFPNIPKRGEDDAR